MGISVLEEQAKALYTKVKIRIRFRDRILAGIPKHGDMLDYYMKARHMSDREKDDFKARTEKGELSPEEKEQITSTSWCQFERNAEGHLCLWHGNVKAMLREIFVTLGLTQKKPSLKKAEKEEDKGPSAGGRQTLQHAVHVDSGYPDSLRIPFERDGKLISEPDGSVDKVKHIKDAAGQRSALGRHDYLEKVEMQIILKWPTKSVFTEDDFKKVLALCQDDGLGACRSQGNGKFDVISYERM